eukprot:NODE_1088_length_2256_cov_0.508577.p1 type:complete len:126 gc:universal NODE_1088_length_2256_cov_0.508577:723-346(-)
MVVFMMMILFAKDVVLASESKALVELKKTGLQNLAICIVNQSKHLKCIKKQGWTPKVKCEAFTIELCTQKYPPNSKAGRLTAKDREDLGNCLAPKLYACVQKKRKGPYCSIAATYDCFKSFDTKL